MYVFFAFLSLGEPWLSRVPVVPEQRENIIIV